MRAVPANAESLTQVGMALDMNRHLMTYTAAAVEQLSLAMAAITMFDYAASGAALQNLHTALQRSEKLRTLWLDRWGPAATHTPCVGSSAMPKTGLKIRWTQRPVPKADFQSELKILPRSAA